MANNVHGYVSTMRASCENVDAFNRVGIYSTGDLDNGVFVTLTGINKGSSDKVLRASNILLLPLLTLLLVCGWSTPPRLVLLWNSR